jgi:hypothetical protein
LNAKDSTVILSQAAWGKKRNGDEEKGQSAERCHWAGVG